MTKTIEEIAKSLKLDPVTPHIGVVPAPVHHKDKIKKIKKDGTPDKRGNNGGKGNIGRKPLAQDEKRRSLKKIYEDFAMEDDDVRLTDQGTKEVRVVKMKKMRIVHEVLYKKAKEGDVSAIKEFNDRTVGKSKQPITGGDEDDTPLRIDVDLTGTINKIYGSDDE